MSQEVKYSICIPNLNMEKTIEKALRSVLDQVDENFEVIVVDDGSSDKSLYILRKLETEYESLRVYSLDRDKNRTLAQTRNISISFAQGHYLILHIDCDDFWHPYIKDFVKVYHEIEQLIGSDFLLSGQQINMGESSFLRKHGPYGNSRWGEDRDLWYRMAKIGRWIPLDHVSFRDRLDLPTVIRYKKKFILPVSILIDEIQSSLKFKDVLKTFFVNKSNQSKKYLFYRMLCFPFAWLAAKCGKGVMNAPMPKEWEELKKDAWEKSGCVADLFDNLGESFQGRGLSEVGRKIFAFSHEAKTLEELMD